MSQFESSSWQLPSQLISWTIIVSWSPKCWVVYSFLNLFQIALLIQRAAGKDLDPKLVLKPRKHAVATFLWCCAVRYVRIISLNSIESLNAFQNRRSESAEHVTGTQPLTVVYI